MINIISREPENTFIKNVDAYFNAYVEPCELDSVDMSIIEQIDRAVLLDKNTGSIKTPYGLTNIYSLSSGCKTVIGYRHRRRQDRNKIYNITMAGKNALEVLFNVVEDCKDSKTVFYLGYCGGLYTCKQRDFNVDGITVRSLSRGLSRHGRK